MIPSLPPLREKLEQECDGTGSDEMRRGTEGGPGPAPGAQDAECPRNFKWDGESGSCFVDSSSRG